MTDSYTSFTVSPGCFGHVVGRKWNNVQLIQKRTRATIRKARKQNTLEIIGKPLQRQEAYEQLRAINLFATESTIPSRKIGSKPRLTGHKRTHSQAFTQDKYVQECPRKMSKSKQTIQSKNAFSALLEDSSDEEDIFHGPAPTVQKPLTGAWAKKFNWADELSDEDDM